MAIPSWLYLSETAGTSGITTITVSAGTNTLSEIKIKRLKVATDNTNMDREVAILQEASGYTGDTGEYENEYLTIEALEDGQIAYENRQGTFYAGVQYSINGSEWEEYNGAINVNRGDKVRWKGTNKRYSSGTSSGKWFTYNMTVKVYGNIMSLTQGDYFKTSKTLYSGYTFAYLFASSTSTGALVDASNLVLPATNLSDYCYYRMFANNGGLVKPPKELPATVLTDYCYTYMFYRCNNLESIPNLPATTLSTRCYYQMFYGCTSLINTVDILPATALTSECYRDMFTNCRYITIAPKLPATTLAQSCYANMFAGCNSLISCPSLPATSLAIDCYNSMFSGCTNITNSPDLLAENLTDSCYGNMFSGCKNLNYVKCMASDLYYGVRTTTDWLRGVSSTGTFVKRGSTTWPSGDSGIPSGWTIQ